jgi:hypothetical protein
MSPFTRPGPTDSVGLDTAPPRSVARPNRAEREDHEHQSGDGHDETNGPGEHTPLGCWIRAVHVPQGS